MLGFSGLSLLFSDLGPGETYVSRALIAGLFFFLASLFIGYFNPSRWWLSGLVAWGGVFLGIGALLGSPGKGAKEFLLSLGVLVLPLGISLFGGKRGAKLNKRKYDQRSSNARKGDSPASSAH